jgi:hypothetical protein
MFKTFSWHYHYFNRKPWEELTAYFPWYDTGHIEKDASNNSSIVACVFVTAVTFIPSRCLATIGGLSPSRCLATIRGFLPSRFLATIEGINRHTHMHTATWSHKPILFFQNKESRLKIIWFMYIIIHPLTRVLSNATLLITFNGDWGGKKKLMLCWNENKTLL